MKFADEYFNEIKPGIVLINIGNTDDEFTKGIEYEVRQDEEGLFVVDDCGYEELFNLTLAQYFIIKEPDKTTLQKDLERYKQWIKDLQSGMYVNCVYCGHRYGPEDKIPVSMADALKQHIEQCPEHPLTQYKRALNEVCTDLACDDQCPNSEPDFIPWPECLNCLGNIGEIHQNTERDIKYWERYYLNKAIAGLEPERGDMLEKRLTARSPKSNMAYLVNVKNDEQELEGSYNTLICVRDALERLAEYEETGFTPEQIKGMEFVVFDPDCKHPRPPRGGGGLVRF